MSAGRIRPSETAVLYSPLNEYEDRGRLEYKMFHLSHMFNVTPLSSRALHSVIIVSL